MSDLITWLRAQIDADERNLQAGLAEYLGTRLENDFRFQFAELDAKRRILEALAGEVVGDSFESRFHLALIELLALPYADREGYRDEWRPDE